MGTYYKPQSPIQSGEDFIYPLTTSDQVMVDEDTRLNAVAVYLENINNSTDTTVYGNNATTLGGVAAEDYALKTDTAPDSSKLGGKAPEYYLQPRNLLDNSDFTNPVNQRGQTSYSGGYGIDRWKQWSNSHTTTINDNSISISIIQQYIGSNIDFDKTYTIAAKKVDGSILCESGTFNGKLNKNGLRLDYDTNTDGSKKPYACINAAGDYLWATLYEGSYTAETLPPYVSKGYAAELAECQRYYFKGNGYYRASYPAFCNSETVVRTTITLPTEMRITPTATISDLTKVRVYVNGTAITPTALSATAKIANNVMFEFKISGGAVNYGAVVRFGDTITLEFSADL